MWRKKKTTEKNESLVAEATAVPVAVPVKDDHPTPSAPIQSDFPAPLSAPPQASPANASANNMAPQTQNSYQPPPQTDTAANNQIPYGQQPVQQPLHQNSVQPLPPQRSKLHNLHRLLRILGIGGSLNMVVGEIWGMTLHRIPLEEDIVRCYIIGFSVIILLNEMELSQMLRDSPVLSNWIPRGILYSFVGIVGLVMNDIGNDQYFENRMRKYNNYYNNQSAYTFIIPTTEQACEAYIRFGSFFMFFYGIFYSILGALRIQVFAKRQKEEYKQNLAAYNQHYGLANSAGCLV